MLAIVRAAIDGASVARALTRALGNLQFLDTLSLPVHVLAAGKAAGAMATAIANRHELRLRRILAIGTHISAAYATQIEFHEASHPVPDQRSIAAARRALQFAADVPHDECLLILLSGGASALMAMPAEGLTLEDKQRAVRTMLLAGADIHALNTVRKHLSSIKGGRLAAGCRGRTLTLAVSDVQDDDLSVIGSGPGVPDESTWSAAADALERFGGAAHSNAVHEHIQRGLRGEIVDTPKSGDPTLARAHAAVIASKLDALSAARDAALRLGYRVSVLDTVVCGEAREAAAEWFARARALGDQSTAPLCVLSAGETTVRVTGSGRGGRNQEFVLALVERLARERAEMLVASIGTDGIDGPTDAAGALADRTTQSRAAALGLSPEAFLRDNNSYDFFAVLGDLVHTGRTDTNVGDVQVFLRP